MIHNLDLPYFENPAILFPLAREGLFKDQTFMSFVQSTIEYIKSSKAELEKVSWPSRQDTIRYSALVIVISVVVAVFFAVLDFSLGKAVDGLLSRGTPPPAQTQTQTAPEQKPIDMSGVQVEGVTQSGKTVPLKVTPIK